MKDGYNLIDINFNSLSQKSKRDSFVLMDIVLKKLHQQGMMVTDFDPSTIHFQNGFYFFNKTAPIANYFSNKDEAVLRNIIGMANLAFCSYLPDYQLKQGLLSVDVISSHFNDFSSIFASEDKEYYKTILVDAYSTRSLPPGATLYYSDYRHNLNKIDTGKGHTGAINYVKSTEAGRAMADKDEAAFGHNFFLATAVMSLCVMLIGIIIYFSTYFG